MRRLLMMATLATLTAAGACSGDPEPPPPPAPPPAAPPPPSRQATQPAPPPRDDSAELARMRETLAERVFFDYDRSEVRADQRAVLDRKARLLREQPTIRIRVEGHADERGSTEYNLALGSRRAESVRAYLRGVGIDAGRIEITSFGESRPLQRGTGESAWSQNRRAEFSIVGGNLTTGR